MRLLTISLIISLVGIFALLFFSVQQAPKEITGKAIQDKEYLEVTGKIVSIKSYDEFNIIKLDNGMTVVCFDCNFSQGQEIKVTGTVSEYQGEKQINAEKIDFIR